MVITIIQVMAKTSVPFSAIQICSRLGPDPALDMVYEYAQMDVLSGAPHLVFSLVKLH